MPVSSLLPRLRLLPILGLCNLENPGGVVGEMPGRVREAGTNIVS